MSHTIYSQARTTPLIHKEIKESILSDRKLAAQYGISRSTSKMDAARRH
jgi:hypothetical protein